ncbi:hypothetical protein KAT92_05190 [Candidatus Babeliales bacterium]|nr:hypothetical protein [Candidatus Babeliales bacterium]
MNVKKKTKTQEAEKVQLSSVYGTFGKKPNGGEQEASNGDAESHGKERCGTRRKNCQDDKWPGLKAEHFAINLKRAVEWYFGNEFFIGQKHGWSKQKKMHRIQCTYLNWWQKYRGYEEPLLRQYRGWGKTFAEALINCHRNFLKDRKRIAFEAKCISG